MNRILGVVIITGSFLFAWLMMDFNQFKTTPMKVDAGGMVYLLKPGSSVATLAVDLAGMGVIDNPLYLRLLARLEGTAASIKAGEYRIGEGMTPIGLLQLLVQGEVISHSLTLVEGWTFREMLQAVAAHPALVHTLENLPDEQIMQRLGMEGHPEGRFLPDTYHFPRATRDVDFLKRAARSMDESLNRLWAARDEGLPLQSPYEALTLASIVEKETGLASERAEIAGVFIRRLRKGMRLQTDPTIIYGLGEAFDGNIRRRDLTRDNPYNTYTRSGLPPTPICLPGIDALEAVMHPKTGNSLYFVAKGDGSHHFSSTLDEHNGAVRKYQLKRN